MSTLLRKFAKKEFYLLLSLLCFANFLLADDYIDVIDGKSVGEFIHNTSTCEMTKDLYKKHIGLKDKQSENKKECIQPGCFYIFKQTNLGWQKWAPSLFKKAKHTDENSIMGCRYDIPYLIQRTHGSSDRSLHKILEMLRACFIKDTQNKEKEVSFSFCQPEYDKDYNKTSDGSTATSFNGTGIHNKNFHDSWIDRHLPSVQDKCFYKFASGIFFVKSGKRNLVVCCSDGTKDDEKKFKDACKAVTAGINNMKWREKTKIDG